MKKITFLILATLFAFTFFACKNESKNAAPTVAPDLSGDWANDLWLAEIQRSHSPLLAQTKAELATFSIKKAEKGFRAAVSFNHHEGGEFLFEPLEKGGWAVLEPTGDELRPVFKATISPDGKNLKLRTDTTEANFSKYMEPLDFRVVGGKWKKKGDQKVIEFHRDGTVSGLELFKFYGVFFDYFGGPEQFDQLWLSETGEKGKVFAFKNDGKKLVLSETHCKKANQKPCEEIAAGAAVFELEAQ